MKKFLFLILFLCCENVAFAHGTGYRQINLKAIPLEFFYSTGEKMSYREVKVFSPKDPKFAIQTGRTDEEGRFAFIPDVSGDWRVIVRDEEGHQCEAYLSVNELTSPLHRGDSEKASTFQGEVALGKSAGRVIFINAILGVSLIFNLAFIIRRFTHAH